MRGILDWELNNNNTIVMIREEEYQSQHAFTRTSYGIKDNHFRKKEMQKVASIHSVSSLSNSSNNNPPQLTDISLTNH